MSNSNDWLTDAEKAKINSEYSSMFSMEARIPDCISCEFLLKACPTNKASKVGCLHYKERKRHG